MSDLLEAVIETHGGVERWNQLTFVSARVINVRAPSGLRDRAGVLSTMRKAAHPWQIKR
jgi:hypothetical protein